jgi:hypothetical protein
MKDNNYNFVNIKFHIICSTTVFGISFSLWMSTVIIELAVRLFKLLTRDVYGTSEIITEVIKYISVGNTRNTSNVYK